MIPLRRFFSLGILAFSIMHSSLSFGVHKYLWLEAECVNGKGLVVNVTNRNGARKAVLKKEFESILVQQDGQRSIVGEIRNSQIRIGPLQSDTLTNIILLNKRQLSVSTQDGNQTEVDSTCQVYETENMTLIAYCQDSEQKEGFNLEDKDGESVANFRSLQTPGVYILALRYNSSLPEYIPLIYSTAQIAGLIPCASSSKPHPDTGHTSEITSVPLAIFGGFTVGGMFLAILRMLYSSSVDEEQDSVKI